MNPSPWHPLRCVNSPSSDHSLELVVVRYHEDLQWLRRVPKRFRVTVYDKGNEPAPLPARRPVAVIPTADRGREEYGYLQHLVSRYDSLADCTVFAQGKPFDHVPDFHKILHRLAFGETVVDPFQWYGFIIDEDDRTGSLLFQRWPKNVAADPLPLERFWQELWGTPAPERVTFHPSAHFAVTRAQVRRQPIDFYRRALSISATLPHAGHCFERVWDRVFNVDGIAPAHLLSPKPVYLRKIRRAPVCGGPQSC
jgi:hypothetical protein